jgi:U4/U6.U5 tri-snRNP component SNU23
LKARDFQIDLAANLNKTRVNALGAPLSQQAGFYCDVCDCILKDSMAYLDHINGKWHNRALGMSMRTERSTTDQVRKRLNELKERKKKSSSANLSAKEGEESEEVHVPDGMSKADLSIGQEKLGRGGINDDGDEEDTHSEGECDKEEEEEDAELSKDASEDIDVASLMGFGNFGGGVKR